jgi:hypothetical protein
MDRLQEAGTHLQTASDAIRALIPEASEEGAKILEAMGHLADATGQILIDLRSRNSGEGMRPASY